MDKEQQDRFRRAVDEKESDAAERQVVTAEQQLDADEREPGVDDPRTKSSRHGQVTADKWNQ